MGEIAYKRSKHKKKNEGSVLGKACLFTGFRSLERKEHKCRARVCLIILLVIKNSGILYSPKHKFSYVLLCCKYVFLKAAYSSKMDILLSKKGLIN